MGGIRCYNVAVQLKDGLKQRGSSGDSGPKTVCLNGSKQ